MPKVFISYRRADSLDVTGRIYDRLEAHFGRASVFLDLDSIPFGVDFREHLDSEVGQCDVLLAVIGDSWLEQRRLHDPRDFVRIEIESALARGIPVVPVLVGRATMPAEEDLPESLKQLAYRNAAEVRSGRDFSDHVARLIRGIETRQAPRKSASASPLAPEGADPLLPMADRLAIKCPFCHYENEDGTLFCKRCTSDLSGVPSTPRGSVPPPPLPMAESAPPKAADRLTIKCPFCHYENEDGALFCERCTSDLYGVASTPEASPPPPPPPVPMAESLPPRADRRPIRCPVCQYANKQGALSCEGCTAELPRATSLRTTLQADVRSLPGPPVALASSYELLMQAAALPPNARPKLLVLRGQKLNAEYPIYPGMNVIGRAGEKPVDVDLEEQEPPDRIWCSRQHACIAFENDQLLIEDLSSANGTYVNRTRVYPGQKRPLAVNDVVQIGNVQMKVMA